MGISVSEEPAASIFGVQDLATDDKVVSINENQGQVYEERGYVKVSCQGHNFRSS